RQVRNRSLLEAGQFLRRERLQSFGQVAGGVHRIHVTARDDIPERMAHVGAFLRYNHRLGVQKAAFQSSLSSLALSSGGSFSSSAASASISGSLIGSSLLASSAGVGHRKTVGTGIRNPSDCPRRVSTCVARNESPPREKKLSFRPTTSRPSTSQIVAATSRSMSDAGAS